MFLNPKFDDKPSCNLQNPWNVHVAPSPEPAHTPPPPFEYTQTNDNVRTGRGTFGSTKPFEYGSGHIPAYEYEPSSSHQNAQQNEPSSSHVAPFLDLLSQTSAPPQCAYPTYPYSNQANDPNPQQPAQDDCTW